MKYALLTIVLLAPSSAPAQDPKEKMFCDSSIFSVQESLTIKRK